MRKTLLSLCKVITLFFALLLLNSAELFSQQIISVNINTASCTPNRVSNLKLPDDCSYDIIPNPNYGVFSVKINNTEKIKALHLYVFDMFGQMVYSGSDVKNINEISISIPQLTKGVYFVSIHFIDINNSIINSNKKFIKY